MKRRTLLDGHGWQGHPVPRCCGDDATDPAARTACPDGLGQGTGREPRKNVGAGFSLHPQRSSSPPKNGGAGK